MATHSSILARKIPQTEEPGGLQSMGSQSQLRLSDWAHSQKKEMKFWKKIKISVAIIDICIHMRIGEWSAYRNADFEISNPRIESNSPPS